MKFARISLALLACATTASAQYFSEGWAPGKPVTQAAAPAATFVAEEPAAAQAEQQDAPRSSGKGGFFDISKIFETGPFKSVFNAMGVNISQTLENARAAAEGIWDPRVPFLTDENYDAMIVNETLTEEEEDNRTWFVLITAQTAQQRGGVSRFLDESFDSAYNTSIIEGDLPDVRWARIDYMNVTYITSKWNVWSAPYVVVIRDRGQTLYFFQARSVRLTAEHIRDFLKKETWRQSVPWKSPIAPGGDYEKIMHYYAKVMQIMYRGVEWIPKWALMFLSGGIASLIMPLLHRSSSKPKPATTEKPAIEAATTAGEPETTETAGASTSTPKKSAKSRKAGKK